MCVYITKPPSFKFLRPSVIVLITLSCTFNSSDGYTLALFVHFSAFVSLLAVSEYKVIHARPCTVDVTSRHVLHHYMVIVFETSTFDF